MKVRLIKSHTVNGTRIEPGAIIELPTGSASNLIEWGVGEAYMTPAERRAFEPAADTDPEVPHTK